MAKVPLPEQGQPLDVAYIYQLSSAINDLSNQISTGTMNYTTVDTNSAGKQNIKTSDARIIAAIYKIDSFSTQQAQTTKTFTYSWNGNFKYAPVVTATPVNRSGGGGAGDDVQVVITSVTQSGVSGIVKFNVAGTNIQVDINLIAVGIPDLIGS
jgi:hypothetical protein